MAQQDITAGELPSPATDLPILRQADAAVLGGSVAGVAAALRLRHAGFQVVLIEPRTYLGRELTATLRPWVQLGPPSALWSVLAPRLGVELTMGETPLHPDALKRTLEDLLLEAGVDLLYASLPVDVLEGREGVEGVVIANKSGRQVIAAPVVIDATETALVARLAGGQFEPLPPLARFARTLEFDRVAPLTQTSLPVPPQLGVVDNRVQLHRGYRGGEHRYVSFELELAAGEGLRPAMRREMTARRVSLELATYLIANVPAFQEAALGSASYELAGPSTRALAGSAAQPFAGPLPGLWCLNEAARVPQPQAFRDPVQAAALAEAAADLIATRPQAREEAPAEAEVPAVAGVQIRELASPQPGRPYSRRPVPGISLPLLDRVEVLVVGGGSSGATAAITAAREGGRTALLEMNPGLGGTGTLGGVHSYWYGRHLGFSARVEALTAAVHQSLGHTKSTWNIEAKMQALLAEAERVGVEVLWGALAYGTIMQGERVRGVVAATRWGPVALLAEVTIDATGDGDLAAFAGAEFLYGAERDHTTMWASLAQFSTPGRTRNNFTSSADVSNVEDYTRAILAGRRRGHEVHDHGTYLAPRESRHILGEVALTHTDQLVRRHWPDVINLHYSNHDVKGPSTSPWVRMGLIPPNLEIEVPYRALIPRALEGLIVAGKAISATHDALPAIRMQADLENLGGVVGLAAVQAVRQGVTPGQIEVSCLQQRLLAEGVLSDEVLARPAHQIQLGEDDLAALVALIDGTEPLYAYSNMEMGEIFEGRIPFVDVCLADERIIPHLESAAAGATGLRRIHLAQALAFHRAESAVPLLIEAIVPFLAGDQLPGRDNRIRHANDPPDQGAMPDVVYLLYSLGMVRDPRSLPIFARVAELIEATEADMRDRRKGTFYYVEAVAWALEQLGDRAAIPILRQLHASPALHGQMCRSGFQPDYFHERQALLELCIARAQARCGDEEGIRTLVAYLDDNRSLLAASARAHLATVTGQDFGRSSVAWAAVLPAAARGPFRPVAEPGSPPSTT